MNKLEAVIFDMDGLMLDTERLAIPSIKRAGTVLGINLTDDILIEMNGLNEDDSHVAMEKKLGISIPKKEFADAFHDDYEKAIAENGVPIKEGLIELIDLLEKNNIRRAVATSTKHSLALKKLKLAGIIDRFEVIIGGDQVEKGKPAPDPYLKAADKLGVHVDNCLALEDSDNGAMSAYIAGIKVIVIPDIKQPSPKTASIALNIYDSLSEVNKYLQTSGVLSENKNGEKSGKN
ncbi:MAG: HAD family phosphatase [Proteobacteria bacterium]|nr:HAD family phosphatase [Pseudomonadota bacterium]